MLFNTKDFAIFFIIVLALYWLSFKWKNARNLLLVAGSWYFYYCFRGKAQHGIKIPLYYSLPVYLFVIICIGYAAAILISKAEEKRKRKTLLIFSVVLIGLGLTYTKYSGLIFGNIPGMQNWQASALGILVPIGISYFTFNSIGYISDVYRKKTQVELNFITYAAYISYFPHILSGPIPSSAAILPQFSKAMVPSFQQVERSLGEITWGLFKKMVVADNMVMMVNYCFANYTDLNGSTLFIGVTSFSLYLYADFSGYSDIAMGVSRLMGIELTRNFQMPFFSRNPAEFWRRWHTSLRKWMLDYIYLPMGGNQNNKLQYIFLILFIFSFSGLWHGANYTFICWGLLNGLYFIPYILSGTLVRYKTPPSPGKILPTLKEFLQIILTFNLVTITRIFFRSPDIYVVKDFCVKIFSLSLFEAPLAIAAKNLLWCVPMLAFEWLQREKTYFLEFKNWNIFLRSFIYVAIIVAIWQLCPKMDSKEYYYFKF